MREFVIYIPEELKRHNIPYLLKQVFNTGVIEEPNKYYFEFDFSHLKFIDPVGITALSNLFEWMMKRNVEFNLTSLEFRYHIMESRRDPIRFLDDSGFFERYCGNSLSTFANIRDTTIELEYVAHSDSYNWLEQKFIPWLSDTLHQPKDYFLDLQQCILEIFYNISDHANEQIGCVFAQHFPADNEVKVAISDFGVGIPRTVRSVLPSYNDAECLLKAVEKNFTSKKNIAGGAGLDILLENMLNKNKGSVYIHSNCGILKCNHFENVQNHLTQGFYPGTLFELVFRTDTVDSNLVIKEDVLWDLFL